MEIKVVVDNRIERGRGLLAVHGFSAYIELRGKKILFDTGQGKGIVTNAALMGIDLEDLDAVVLSHGHYDHTGGLGYVRAKEIYYHPTFFTGQFKGETYIGPEFVEKDLKKMGFEPKVVDGVVELFGAYLVNKVESYNDFEKPTLTDGLEKPFYYEISMAIPVEEGLFVVTGCSHRGICNIVTHMEKVLGRKVAYVLGGLHLFDAGRELLEKTASFLKEKGIKVYGCHCTGERGAVFLSLSMGELFERGYVGMRIRKKEVEDG